MNWLISMWRAGSVEPMSVGTRVKTPWGQGVITGGQLNIRLDGNHPNAAHVNDKTVSLQITKVKVL